MENVSDIDETMKKKMQGNQNLVLDLKNNRHTGICIDEML